MIKLFKFFLTAFLAVLIALSLGCLISSSFAANCNTADCNSPEDCQRKIQECQEIISAYTPAQTKNKEQLAALEKQLNNLEKLVNAAEIQIKKVEKEIFAREVDLEYQREIFSARVRNYYIRSQQFSPFLLFLASENANQLTRELSYRTVMANEDRKVILKISGDLNRLQTDKDELETNKNWLAKSKETVGKQTTFLRGEVEKVEGYLGEISGKIAALTTKQQALLTEKAGTFQTTVGEVPLADDPNARPDFDPGFRPAFAAFSFGAPHRKGMSQYGAFGRAKAGQSAEQILKAYYGDVRIEQRDLPATISTTVGVLDFENNYLKGIAEMPSSWADEGGFEALKAQVIAARSYALRAGKPICVTEACQVYKSSKAASPPDAWRRAVEETRGMVVVSNSTNDVVSTWYASTAGGYTYSYTSVGHTTPGSWDTSCGNQSCWTGEAWEKKSGSPWFYKGWYKTRDGKTCGRSHPWLSGGEMADILNAVAVYRSGGDPASHILPVDYNSCFGKSGDPWSIDQMRQEASGKGGGFNSVDGVSVTYAADGKTANLTFATNQGNYEVSGEEFYTVFNLRASGKISLKSKLFNIEKK